MLKIIRLIVCKFKPCGHRFKSSEIKLTGIPVIKTPKTKGYKEWSDYFDSVYECEGNTKRVSGTCVDCGSVKYARCGLDLPGKLI